jgi:hypothetical protein
MELVFGERTKLDNGLKSPDGSEVYSHTIYLGESAYVVYFVPQGVWEDTSLERVTAAVGRQIPAGAYEVKFDLAANFTGASGDQFRSRADVGLESLGICDLMQLGAGILTTMLMFRDDFGVPGFYAAAVEDNGRLCQYYRRLYRRHEDAIRKNGLEPIASEGGFGYAFYCQRHRTESSQAAEAAAFS